MARCQGPGGEVRFGDTGKVLCDMDGRRIIRGLTDCITDSVLSETRP